MPCCPGWRRSALEVAPAPRRRGRVDERSVVPARGSCSDRAHPARWQRQSAAALDWAIHPKPSRWSEKAKLTVADVARQAPRARAHGGSERLPSGSSRAGGLAVRWQGALRQRSDAPCLGASVGSKNQSLTRMARGNRARARGRTLSTRPARMRWCLASRRVARRGRSPR